MATARQFREIALSLAGTLEAAHVDRAAFRVNRIYATLAPDGRSANLKFAPDEQELKCLTAPDAFERIPNGWGRMGWTTATLAALNTKELRGALETAWRHALPKTTKKRKGSA